MVTSDVDNLFDEAMFSTSGFYQVILVFFRSRSQAQPFCKSDWFSDDAYVYVSDLNPLFCGTVND